MIRVFPRRTKATPDDSNVRINQYPGLFDEAEKVHISVTFTWDISVAEALEKQWRHVAPTYIGGPAIGERGETFVPGRYLKKGYIITSRGCPNRCWFCSVWRREGSTVRELPITNGYNVLDDNLLACSDDHIKAVFDMLGNQPERPQFTGGLEAARLKQWHVDELIRLKTKQMFFAYDTPDDLEPLIYAGRMLIGSGYKISSHGLRCYVLCGYKDDTFNKAEKRMIETMKAGFMPMAMLYRDKQGDRDYEWMKWARQWARPAIMSKKYKETNL